MPELVPTALAANLRQWARELGFDQLRIIGTNLAGDFENLQKWLDAGMHGEMGYMERNLELREHPERLHEGTIRIVLVRMNYADGDIPKAWETLRDPQRAYISRYALGRDYHKTIRGRLRALARRIEERIGPFGHRAFCDSAPVMEKALARLSGLGWIGKHSLALDRGIGSFFFIGALFTDLPLPIDPPQKANCGNCRRCIDICPTQAIIAPYVVDARRCISYLTIESRGSIPEEFREAIGNRIFGCDDCQLVCPWNKHVPRHTETDFNVRHGLDTATLAELFLWTEEEFLKKTEGSAIRRTGYIGWLRNIAVALGNARPTPDVLAALQSRAQHESPIVREHIEWALSRHRA
jgi:epoxyqueuosine reductase